MKSLLFFFLLFLISNFAFAANECSNDPIYKAHCNTREIVPSYKCVIDKMGEFEFSHLCKAKSKAILDGRCTKEQLAACDTPANDERNFFEMCLFNQGGPCAAAIVPYKDE